MASRAIIQVPIAELLLPSNIPEIGEFYNADTGDRLVGLAMSDSSTLASQAFGVNMESVRRTEISEQTLTSYNKSVKQLGIDASLEMTLLSGKLHMQGSVSYINNEDNAANTIKVVKSARIITHRRTVNFEDIQPLTDDIVAAINNAKAVGEATHICTELIFGHYVTMTLTYTGLNSATVQTIDVSASGEANFESIQGSIKGAVKITKDDASSSFNLNVEYNASEPTAALLLPTELDTQSLYDAAVNAFNNAIDLFAQSGQSGASVLGFSYTPIDWFLTSRSVSDQLRDDRNADMSALYADVDSAAANLRRLYVDPRGRFCPRLVNEIAACLWSTLKLQTDLRNLILDQAGKPSDATTRFKTSTFVSSNASMAPLVAALAAACAALTTARAAVPAGTEPTEAQQTAIDAAQKQVDEKNNAMASMAVTVLQNQFSAISQPLRISPLFANRLELIQKRADELASYGVCLVGSLMDVGRIFNTSERYLATVAAVPLLDGKLDAPLCRWDNATQTWKTYTVGFDVTGVLDSVNQTINNVVDSVVNGVGVKGFVLDALSWAGTGVLNDVTGDGTADIVNAWRQMTNVSIQKPFRRLDFVAGVQQVDAPITVARPRDAGVSVGPGISAGRKPAAVFRSNRGQYLQGIFFVDVAGTGPTFESTVPPIAVIARDATQPSAIQTMPYLGGDPPLTLSRTVAIVPIYTEYAENAAREIKVDNLVTTVAFADSKQLPALSDALFIPDGSNAPAAWASVDWKMPTPPLGQPTPALYVRKSKVLSAATDATGTLGTRFLEDGLYSITLAGNPNMVFSPSADLISGPATDSAGTIFTDNSALYYHNANTKPLPPAMHYWQVTRIAPYYDIYYFIPAVCANGVRFVLTNTGPSSATSAENSADSVRLDDVSLARVDPLQDPFGYQAFCVQFDPDNSAGQIVYYDDMPGEWINIISTPANVPAAKFRFTRVFSPYY